MHSTIALSSLVAGLTLLFVATHAHPAMGPLNTETCASSGGQKQYKYTVDKTETNIDDPPALTGKWACGGLTGTCTSTVQESYSVAVTWEVGIDLGLELAKIAGEASISASVSTTTETQTTQGATLTCPKGPWFCAMSIKPRMTRVSGIATPLAANCQELTDKASPYTALLPEKGTDGLQGGSVEICVCKNYKHWAETDLPGCPQDCSR